MLKALAITSAFVAAGATAVTINAAQATPGAGHSGSDTHSSRNITVVERAVSDSVTDTGPSGDSVGDLLTFANPIYDRSDTHKVGSDNGSCIRTVVGKAWQCSWTTRLRGGSLVVEGPFYDTHDSVLAITGGTGAYSRARGQMHLHALNAEGTAFRFAFEIE